MNSSGNVRSPFAELWRRLGLLWLLLAFSALAQTPPPSLPKNVNSSLPALSSDLEIPRNRSVVVACVVPKVVRQGQPFTASITLRNTGAETWTDEPVTPHRLGSFRPLDTPHWREAHRRDLPAGSVPPGETVSFTLECVATMPPGVYPFAWRMVEDGR